MATFFAWVRSGSCSGRGERMQRRCPRCQTSQRPTAKFCRACGTPLEPARPPESSASLETPVLSPETNPRVAAPAAMEEAPPSSTFSEESPPKNRGVIVAEQVIAIPWAEAIEAGQEEIEGIADGLHRVEAALLDLFVALATGFAALVATSTVKDSPTINQLGTAAALAVAGVFVINEWVLLPLRGQSVGMSLVGIRLVRDTGETVRPARCLVRHTVGYLLSALPLGLGFFWIFIDAAHRGWHDRLTRTLVVKVRSHGQTAHQNAGKATLHG